MKKTLCFAFKQTIPVLFGYLFMGAAFGILLQKAGFNFIWAFFISLTCYSGSMQFALVSLLTSGASLLHSAFMTLLISFRHVFYGLSLVDRFKKAGSAQPYLIHALTDETYSLLCLIKPRDDMNDKHLMLCISCLNHIYWITGCTLGALIGSMLTFNSAGIDFAMTALFVVILIEQWKEAEASCHTPVFIGGGCALVSLLLFGPNNFLPPALIATIIILLFLRAQMLARLDLNKEEY